MSKPEAIIVDMDGTLADVTSIRHHVRHPARDFDAFHAASVDAPVHGWVRDLAVDAHQRGLAVLIVTARKARWRHHTAWFLAMHGVPSDALIMRADTDQRPDVQVKRAMLNEWIRPAWVPVLAVDDNPAVLALWEQEGIPVVRVPGWETADN